MRKVAFMSRPRRIRKGKVWFVSRRGTRRSFILRPDANGQMQLLYWYVTAVFAAKFGVLLHAVQIMSTHMHEVLTDVHGVLPAFLRERNRIFANCLKEMRDWPEEVFQRKPASCIELLNPAAIAKQIGYTLANCVEAGLVDHPDDWPGVSVRVDDMGRTCVEVARPKVWFDPDNTMWPEVARIELSLPQPLLDECETPDRVRAFLEAVVREAVESARGVARALNRVARSLRDVLESPFARRARSAEPRRSRVPPFACGGDARLAREAATEIRAFYSAYEAAKRACRDGLSPNFPEGTWRWARELFPPACPP